MIDPMAAERKKGGGRPERRVRANMISCRNTGLMGFKRRSKEMPHDYTQTVRSFFEAFVRQDRQRFIELLDPRVEWTSAENFLYADQSPYVGVDAVLKLIFERLPADWDDFSLSAGEILGSGDLVIASGRFL